MCYRLTSQHYYYYYYYYTTTTITVASAALEASTAMRWDCRDRCRDCSSAFTIRESVFVSLALFRALTGSFTSTPSSDSDSQIRTRLSEGPTNTFPGYLRIASGSRGFPPLFPSPTSSPRDWKNGQCPLAVTLVQSCYLFALSCDSNTTWSKQINNRIMKVQFSILFSFLNMSLWQLSTWN